MKTVYPSLKSRELEDLQLEVECTRRLRLVAIAHIYSILLHIIHYSYLLARTMRVGVTVARPDGWQHSRSKIRPDLTFPLTHTMPL